MKILKTTLSKKGLNVLLALTLLGLMSCHTEQEKSNSTATKKAPDMTIHEATFMGNVKAIKGHIEAKTDLNQKDQYGSAPLTIAATFGKTEVAKALINGGADINVTSNDGSTPLHTAAFFGRSAIVKSLLEKGADITVKNNFGSTALQSISVPFENVKAVYDQLSRDLGPFGLKLDYEQIKSARPVIAEMIKNNK